jgi:hypothetical protein
VDSDSLTMKLIQSETRFYADPRPEQKPVPEHSLIRDVIAFYVNTTHRNGGRGKIMGRGILLWLLGVPIPIIILLALVWH